MTVQELFIKIRFQLGRLGIPSTVANDMVNIKSHLTAILLQTPAFHSDYTPHLNRFS